MFQSMACSHSEHAPVGLAPGGHPTALCSCGTSWPVSVMNVDGFKLTNWLCINEGARGAVSCLRGLEEVTGTRNMSI